MRTILAGLVGASLSVAAIDAAAQTSQDDDAAIAAALAADAQETAPPAEAPTGSAGVQSLNPDLSIIAAVALAVFSRRENLQTGGHDPTVNGFNLQQLELAAGAAVDPYFRFDANIVFSQEGVEVEEAYGTTLGLPARLQVRAGQLLTRFGRINSTHPHSWDFADQPFALGRVFGGEGNRGLGAEVSWLSPLPWYVELVASATESTGDEAARSFHDDDRLVEGPEDLLWVGALKQFFPLGDDWSLLWGLSGAFGPSAAGSDGRTAVYGTDLFVKWRPITRECPQMVALQTEWLYRRREITGDVLADLGGYAQLTWRFAQRWGTGVRWELGLPARGDAERSIDPLDPDWTEDRHRASVQVTHWPTEFSRLRLQGSVDAAAWRSYPTWAGFLTLELVAGAHGSHAF